MSITPSFADERGALRYLQAFRAHWLQIALLTALAVGAAAAFSYTATKRYQASADLQVQPLPAYGGDPFQGFSLFRQTVDGSSSVVGAARIMSSKLYQDATYKRLGSKKGITLGVTPLSQADIVTVHATAPSADRAEVAANTYAQVIVDTRTTLFQQQLKQRMLEISRQITGIPTAGRANNPVYTTLAGQLATLKAYAGTADPTVNILTPAAAPTAPSWPRPMLSMGIALLIGLLLGGASAVAIELVNPRVGDEDELTLVHRLPILARVPRVPARVAHGYLAGSSLLPSETWRGYRTLRAVLATAGAGGGFPRSILVTSASPGDGKTMTAVNLAITLAAANLRVVLIDADFHRPMIATIFNVTARRDGLIRLLTGKDHAKNTLVTSATHPRLSLLLSNREQTYHLHVLESGRFEVMLRELEKECDVVVVDSPPLPEVAETLAMADAVETVLIAVRLRHTRRERLADLRELLGRRAVSPLGFVVTTRDRLHGPTSSYAYNDDLVSSAPTGRDGDRSGQRSRVLHIGE
jgi:capsular exopolysaccharide synthesis family protein